MKFQKVFYGIVFAFMIVAVVLLFQIQATVDNIKKSTIDNIQSTVDNIKLTLLNTQASVLIMDSKLLIIELSLRTIKPTVDSIKQLCLGIPLLMRPVK
jgi:hypothetical protein